MTTEIPHGFNPILDATVVPLNRIVVVFEPIFSASDRHAKPKFTSPVKKFVERIAIILKTITHKNDEFTFTGGLASFPKVHVKNLAVASCFDLT